MAESEVPIMCTLSVDGVQERFGEFRALFAQALNGVERSPSRLRFAFDADEAREAQIRDLFGREQQCCAFLRFEFERTERGLVVDVTAPPDAAATLDALQSLARPSAPDPVT
jgi:hypothetical protein